MSLYPVIFLVALCGALVATPLARRTALRFDIVDHPGGRKAHHAPMPYLGGLAIYAAFLLFLGGVLLHDYLSPSHGGDTSTPLFQGIAILAGGTLMVALGAIDDRFSLPPLVKLGGQVLAAALLYLAGIRFHFNHYSAILDFPVSMLWVLGMTNAFNLLDNMDGLSVGTAAIACSYFFVLVELEPTKQFIVASMAVALAGACLGFLYYNFNPARIFMGDAGALFLGFMLSVVAMKIHMSGFPNLHAINFFVPLIVLGIPIFDTTLVTVSRLRRHVPVSRGGRDHTSHRLVLLGLTVREAVMTVYLVACALGLAGILLTIAGPRNGILLIASIVVVGLAAGYKLEQVYAQRVLLVGDGSLPQTPPLAPGASAEAALGDRPAAIDPDAVAAGRASATVTAPRRGARAEGGPDAGEDSRR